MALETKNTLITPTKKLDKANNLDHEIQKKNLLLTEQQTETLKRKLEREVNAHADMVSEGWHVINTLRAQQDILHQSEEIQQNAFKMERSYGRELDELKAQLNDQTSLNLKLSTELEGDREDD
ncbi:hypothetical protein D9C73_017029 [Collichthys lucidus]|uniref:Uncharacterized protein n=1 Tax=Collichthys lucidus TaxID=240159 RepID=A0A4U5V6G3_COLLU|nr:hypothetical protein D9C73_017029 [Collichthys lucidus]